MFWAEYLDTETGIWQSVNGDEYDRAVHGTNLRCGDPVCNEAVIHKNCEAVHAGSANIRSHFAAVSRAAHEKNGCTHVSAYTEEHNSVSFARALREGYPVILNLNMNVGSPLYKRFGRAAQCDGLNSRYNRFRHEHTHASVSVRDMESYFKVRKRLQDSSSGQGYVAHCQDLRRLDNFHIGADKNKLHEMFTTMDDELAHSPDGRLEVTGFPRLIEWSPTKAELENSNPSRKHANGFGGVLEKSGKNVELILLNSIQFPNTGLRQDLLAYTRNFVIATPSISAHDVLAAKDQFAQGQTAYISIDWNIVSAEQFRPVPGAHCKDPQRELALAA